MDQFGPALTRLDSLRQSQAAIYQEKEDAQNDLIEINGRLETANKEIKKYMDSDEYRTVYNKLLIFFNDRLSEKILATGIMLHTKINEHHVWTWVEVVSWDRNNLTILISYVDNDEIKPVTAGKYHDSFEHILFLPYCDDIQRLIRLMYPNSLHNFIMPDNEDDL